MDQLQKLAELAHARHGAAVEIERFSSGWIVRIAIHAQILDTVAARNLEDAVLSLLSKMEAAC